MNKDNFKSGYVAIVGEPNVGKSTLMNSILNTKLSITADKPQTTRKKILGIYSDSNSQIIFLDTPGLIKPRYLLQEKMVTSIYSSLSESDLVLAVCEATEKGLINFEKKIIPLLKNSENNTKVILIINKIDLRKKEEVLVYIEKLNNLFNYLEIFPVSALKKFNIKELIDSIKKYLPVHPPYYPPDVLSEHPERFFISEIIREKIFSEFEQEIPYSTEVVILEFKEREKRKTFISAEIFVERENQRMILIGANGSAIKKIGLLARDDIEKFLGKKVYLELFVKVRENWRNSDHYMKKFGYEN